MTVLWSEDFEAGPNGAAITTANADFTTITTGGNNSVFDSARKKTGAFSSKRIGDWSSRIFLTTETIGLFGAEDPVLYSAWVYVDAGQETVDMPSFILQLNSTSAPSVRTVTLRLFPAGAATPGIRFGASSQTEQLLVATPPMDQWVRFQIEWNPTQFIGRVFDEAGDLLGEGTLVNNFLDSGRTVASMRMEQYHGWVDSVTVEEPPPPPRITSAHHGAHVALFTAEAGATETSLMLHGPDDDQPLANVHHGAFAVPSKPPGLRPATISVQTRLASEERAWCQVYAQWYRWNGVGLTSLSRDQIGQVYVSQEPSWSPFVLKPSGDLQSNSSGATVVGSGDVLSDHTDATYIELDQDEGGLTIGLDPLTGEAGATPIITLRIRMQVLMIDPTGFSGTVEVFLATDGAEDNNEIAGFTDGTSSGTAFAVGPAHSNQIVDIEVPLGLGAWPGTDLAEVVAALEDGAYLDINRVTWATGGSVPTYRIYKAEVVVEDPDASPIPEIPSVYTEINVVADAGEGATHWRPVFLFSSTNLNEGPPTPLPEGAKVYVDCEFVPDNGKKVETYLDGDQPGARWEGTPHESPSVYGEAPPPPPPPPPLDTFPVTETMVFEGALADYPGEQVIPYGPVNLTDDSDATAIRLSSAQAADWFVYVVPGSLSPGVTLTIRTNVISRDEPFVLRVRIEDNDGSSMLLVGHLPIPDGLSETTVVLDEPFFASLPTAEWDQPFSPGGTAEAFFSALGPNAFVYLHGYDGSPFEVDVTKLDLTSP